MQSGHEGQPLMIRVVQRQHGGSFLRLAWDPGITWFGSFKLLIERGEPVLTFRSFLIWCIGLVP
jgi:hypothetical protein